MLKITVGECDVSFLISSIFFKLLEMNERHLGSSSPYHSWGSVDIFTSVFCFSSLTLALPDMSHTILQPCFIRPPAETQTSHNFSNQVGWPFLDDSARELFPCFKFQDCQGYHGSMARLSIVCEYKKHD